MARYHHKTTRRKRSKFDPYIVEIATYLSMGMKVREIAELIGYHFDDVPSESALLAFMRSRDLKSKVTQGGTNLHYAAPNCDKCEKCLRVINTNGAEMRVCLTAKKMVTKSCKTSPIWCEKRTFETKKGSH